MPVFFYIDPDIVNDPSMKNTTNITLSYTFFKTGDEKDELTEGQVSIVDTTTTTTTDQKEIVLTSTSSSNVSSSKVSGAPLSEQSEHCVLDSNIYIYIYIYTVRCIFSEYHLILMILVLIKQLNIC